MRTVDGRYYPGWYTHGTRTVVPAQYPLPHPGYTVPHTVRGVLLGTLTPVAAVQRDGALGSSPPAQPGQRSFCLPELLKSVYFRQSDVR